MTTRTLALARSMRRAGWIASVSAAVAGLLLLLSPWSERLSMPIADLVTHTLRALGPRTAPEPVLVGLDQATLDASAEPPGLMHHELADLLEGLALARPRLIVLDLALPERSAEAQRPGYDAALLRALAAARDAGLLVVIDADAEGRLRAIHPPLLAAVGADAVAVALHAVDADPVVRRVEALRGGATSFATRAAQALGQSAGAGWIDWSLGQPYRYQSMQTVIAAQRRGDLPALRAAFEGRVVLVGSVLPFVQRQPQPVSLAGWERGAAAPPAVLVHAQAIRSLMAGGLLQPLPLLAQLAVVCLLSAFAAAGALAARARRLALLMLASFAAALALVPAGWLLPLAAPWLAGLSSFLLRTGLDARLHRREQTRLRRTFGGYVSPQVLRAILDGEIRAGGGRRHLAFLFADLRGFTRFAESAPPERVLAWLNRYYAAITPVIHAQGGTIDNFRGDGLMVMFGAPEPMERPARAAIEAALAVCAALDRLNAELQTAGEPPLEMALGVAAGDAVYGDLGSPERKDFTALGDAVNVAARLQDVAKELGWRLVVSRAALRESELDAAAFTELGPQSLKGHSPVAVCGWGRVA